MVVWERVLYWPQASFRVALVIQQVSEYRLAGGTTGQIASRLLVIMDVLGIPVSGSCPVPDAVKCVASLTRLMKADFWLRNPDYLADELLSELEAGRQPPGTVFAHVVRMLGGKAPSLHRYPMVKFLYGAYERPDNALAILKSMGLMTHRRAAEFGSRSRRDYYLLAKGAAAVTRIRAEVSEVAWYDQQASAVALLSEAATGGKMRDRQYDQPEYRDAPIGALIEPITDRVRERAVELATQLGYMLADLTQTQAVGHEEGHLTPNGVTSRGKDETHDGEQAVSEVDPAEESM